MRQTWFYEIGTPSNPECIGSTKATTASEAWQRVRAMAKGRPCAMAGSRKVQSIDPGRKALAAGQTISRDGSDGVTEYMADGGSNPPVAATAGKIDIYREGHGYRVNASFKGGGEAWAHTRRAAERIAASAGRWWRRHQDSYLAQLACVLDPGDRMPRGWTPPRRRG